MGEWKHKLWTRVDADDFAFIMGLGEGVLTDASDKLRFAVRALRGYTVAGRVSVSLSDVQAVLRPSCQHCPLHQHPQREGQRESQLVLAAHQGNKALPRQRASGSSRGAGAVRKSLAEGTGRSRDNLSPEQIKTVREFYLALVREAPGRVA